MVVRAVFTIASADIRGQGVSALAPLLYYVAFYFLSKTKKVLRISNYRIVVWWTHTIYVGMFVYLDQPQQ